MCGRRRKMTTRSCVGEKSVAQRRRTRAPANNFKQQQQQQKLQKICTNKSCADRKNKILVDKRNITPTRIASNPHSKRSLASCDTRKHHNTYLRQTLKLSAAESLASAPARLSHREPPSPRGDRLTLFLCNVLAAPRQPTGGSTDRRPVTTTPLCSTFSAAHSRPAGPKVQNSGAVDHAEAPLPLASSPAGTG